MGRGKSSHSSDSSSPRRRTTQSQSQSQSRTQPEGPTHTQGYNQGPSNTQSTQDDVPNILYRPRTITVMLGIGAYFLYYALFPTVKLSFAENSVRGVIAAATVFIFYGMTQLPVGPFIRPHPVFWKAVQAVSIIYLVSLVFIFYQNVEDARRILAFIDPSLGVPLPEKSYAEDCRFRWASIYPQLDGFVLAHIFGWYIKALILRDHWLCWIISIMFEFMEYSLQHQLPNFAECWWDHWILDVLISNWLGIWAGMKTCQYLAMKTYDWRSIQDIPTVTGKVMRTVGQFTPHSWMSFDWAASKTFKGYLTVILLTVFFLASELNCFYLKYLLWVPPEHYLTLGRLVLHALMGSVAMREAYQFFTDPSCKRLGTQAWLTGIIIILETLISVKFGRHQFPNPTPLYVIRFWAIFTTIITLFPVWQFWLRHRIFPSKVA